MKLFAKILVVPALAFPLARGQDSANINLLLGPSTLTAYAPDSALYDGLKVQYDGNLKVWQTKTWGYCPGPPKVPDCPNGTDTVFSEDLGLYPVSCRRRSFPTIVNTWNLALGHGSMRRAGFQLITIRSTWICSVIVRVR